MSGATNIVILIDVVSLDIFQDTIKEMLSLAKNYDKALEEEDKMTPEQLAIKNVGKQDPKRHLEEKVDVMMTTNIVQCLGAMLDAVIFKWREIIILYIQAMLFGHVPILANIQ